MDLGHFSATMPDARLLALAALTLCYLLLVRRLRFAKLRDLERRFAHLTPTSASSHQKGVDGKRQAMSYVDAWEINKVMTFYDAPWMQRQALEFALFQTCPSLPSLPLSSPRTDRVEADAVPTISAVLASTRRLVDASQTGRRAEDTGVLLAELMLFGPDSVRGSLCLSRINYIHSVYGAKISNDDLLFTLSLFIYEPLTFCDRFEWRAPTALEREARFVFWREVGSRMGIRSIPATSEELVEWTGRFVKEKMTFDPVCDQVGTASVELFLRPYPRLLRPVLARLISAILPHPVREAFGWERPHPVYYALIPAILNLRAFILKHLLLPRTKPGDHGLSDPANVETTEGGGKRYFRSGWFFEPFYVKSTFLNKTVFTLLGQKTPGGEGMREDGYTQETLGPEEMRHKGVEKTRMEAERMRGRAQGGKCPFAA